MHLLVAAYLGYEAPEAEEATLAEQPIRPQTVPWMAGMGSIPPSDELKAAATESEALSALEKMFFGNVKEMPHHAQ